MPITTTPTSLSLNDLLRLGSINDHPRVLAAHAQLAEAQRAFDATQQRHAEAQTERHAAETAAAAGRRDDKRLARVQTQLDGVVSDLRIATLALDRLRASVTETVDDVCREIDRDLRMHHRPALEALDRALAEAKRCSDDAARIEDCSRTLLSGWVYRTHPGAPLTDGSWRKEFGGPGRSNGETRYGDWRRFWKFE